MTTAPRRLAGGPRAVGWALPPIGVQIGRQRPSWGPAGPMAAPVALASSDTHQSEAGEHNMKLRMRLPSWSTYTGALGGVIFRSGVADACDEVLARRLLSRLPDLVEEVHDDVGTGPTSGHRAGSPPVGGQDRKRASGSSTCGDRDATEIDPRGAGSAGCAAGGRIGSGDVHEPRDEVTSDQPAPKASPGVADTDGDGDRWPTDRPRLARGRPRHRS